MDIKTKNISRYTVLIGYLAVIIGFLLPAVPNGGLQPMGFISLILCPILGIVGSVFAIIHKDWGFLILNLLQIPAFFIVMHIGYNVLN